MPRGHIIPTLDVTYEQLLDRLKSEWSQPDPSAAEPVIIETVDKLRPQRVPTHLYVIWKDWADLPPRRRSEMIMDAYESVRGRSLALNVTSAMGLTPEKRNCSASVTRPRANLHPYEFVVSTDLKGDPHSSIFSALDTIGLGSFVKVVS